MYDIPIGYISQNMLSLGDKLVVTSNHGEIIEMTVLEKKYRGWSDYKEIILFDHQTGQKRQTRAYHYLDIGCCYSNMIISGNVGQESSTVSEIRFIGRSLDLLLKANSIPKEAEFVNEIDLATSNAGDRIYYRTQNFSVIRHFAIDSWVSDDKLKLIMNPMPQGLDFYYAKKGKTIFSLDPKRTMRIYHQAKPNTDYNTISEFPSPCLIAVVRKK